MLMCLASPARHVIEAASCRAVIAALCAVVHACRVGFAITIGNPTRLAFATASVIVAPSGTGPPPFCLGTSLSGGPFTSPLALTPVLILRFFPFLCGLVFQRPLCAGGRHKEILALRGFG